jgi:hypothetical protein
MLRSVRCGTSQFICEEWRGVGIGEKKMHV